VVKNRQCRCLGAFANLKKQKTFLPKQDRARTFLGKKLGDMVTVDDIYPFTYEEIVRRAFAVDVIWFSDRRMPTEFMARRICTVPS
jgi:hypothetical protein